MQDLHLLLVLHLSGKHALCGYLSLHEKADASGTLVPKQHLEHIKEILGIFTGWADSSYGFFANRAALLHFYPRMAGEGTITSSHLTSSIRVLTS